MSRKEQLKQSIRFARNQVRRHERYALNGKRRMGRLLNELRRLDPSATAGLPDAEIQLLLALGRARRG
jgi:hypothetical protein